MAVVHREIVLAPARRVGATPALRVLDVSHAPGLRLRPHAHASASVTMLVRGAVDEEVEAGAGAVRACSVIVKPAGTVHADVFGPRGARAITIEILDASPARLGPLGRHLAAYRVDDSLAACAAMVRLRSALAAGGDVRRALSDLANALDAHHPTARTRPAPDWLDAVRRALDDDPLHPPPFADLAREVGRHPVSLARAFRARFGWSMTEHVRRARVRRAAAWIADTDRPLAQVARRAGFTDQSHLTRVFARELGLTPARYRALATN